MASKTERFKEHVQKIVSDTLGVEVSKEKAWNLFKNIERGTMQFVALDEDNRLPIAGVGTYEIVFSKPTGKRAGFIKDENGNEVKDPTLEVWNYIPRYKVRTSSTIENELYNIFKCPGHTKEVNYLGTLKEDKEEDEEIAKIIEERDKNDTGERFTLEEVVKKGALKDEVQNKIDVDDLF